MTPENEKIILFDGVCNLCSASVQFVLKHDRKKQFRFASLQSEMGQRLSEKYQLPTSDQYSFVLIEGEKAFTRSTAALRVAWELDKGWSLFYGFIIVPPVIRNAVYNLIARNRYRWFGKKTECWLPTPEWKDRFLD